MLLPFELDPAIVHHIIHSQAGSIAKAVIELLMNSVDAKATTVRVTLDHKGFACADDGAGFASREDVLRYFGRFGTPHQEGDATYGRFRLGRGQIMAHASSRWDSNSWRMTVDTRVMGYNYELDDLDESTSGCRIEGVWYDPLNSQELMSTLQEIRDLVRYTPVSVELNGGLITRDPRAEKWDHEDEFAYYRAREDGAVSIYNQGVLVRHDAGHVWGAGGLIVSKKAIGLNVSRTEILRKTCEVWKPIAKQFGKMADEVAGRLGDHRKTESRREKNARALLSGDDDALRIFASEEVVTLLPGKRHVTMQALLRVAKYRHQLRISVVENAHDVPKAEAIAREDILQLIHPQTLTRFGCYSAIDFQEAMQRIVKQLVEKLRVPATPQHQHFGSNLFQPEFACFETLKRNFVEKTRLVTETSALDKETRRAWTALRWCLKQYVGACLGASRYRSGRLRYGETSFHILLGDSNTAEAWTDGKTYIAIDIQVVKRLKTDPLKTVAYIMTLVEHEVSHEGDSLGCGHDEAFFQRFHDLTLQMAPERQWYTHKWLVKYTTSMENEGKKAAGSAWRERFLTDRAGSGRIDKGLSPLIDDPMQSPDIAEPIPAENMALIRHVNLLLESQVDQPAKPAWDSILVQAVDDQAANLQAHLEIEDAQRQLHEEHEREQAEMMEDARRKFAGYLGIEPHELLNSILEFLMYDTDWSEAQVRKAWEEESWLRVFDFDGDDFFDDMGERAELGCEPDDKQPHEVLVTNDLAHSGESEWSLERNTAAAGFLRVEDYLKWRAEAECQG